MITNTVILSNCCRHRYQTVPNRTFGKLRSTVRLKTNLDKTRTEQEKNRNRTGTEQAQNEQGTVTETRTETETRTGTGTGKIFSNKETSII